MRHPVPAARVAAIVLGAALLVWPAFVNRYPIMFSDTGAFLHQTSGPLMIWDKPYVYGPFLHAFHLRLSLWGPLAAQGLILSHLLWLAQRCLSGAATPMLHLTLAAAVAALTTAPFTIALLMPDVFTSVTVISLFLLGFAASDLRRAERWYLGGLATLAIASHLSHLPLAAALAAAALLADLLTGRPWRTPRVLAPLLAAIAVLLATNAIGHGRVSLSPHGATFLLARLQHDGPAVATLRARCPDPGWYLCAFLDRLPMDSDEFLWSPDSPLNRDADGKARFLGGAQLSPEAGAIVAETLRREPLAVAAAMLRNTAIQSTTFRIGDTLGNEWLSAIGIRLAEGFPPREAEAFTASRQMRGELREQLEPLARLHLPAAGIGVVLAAVATRRAWRRGDARALGLVLFVLVGVGANAFATGALAKPHHRYQARIIWLLPAAALLLSLPRRPGARSVDGTAAAA